MSGQQQHPPQRYGHSHSHSNSHSHGGHSHAHAHALSISQAYAHPHHHDADADNQGGTGGYADIDDEMAMLGYHHPGGPSPLDDYHYPDRPAAADTGPTVQGQYQQRLTYLQQHQHQQRAAAAAAAAQAQAHAHAAASAYGPQPPEHAQSNGWHSHAHLHMHHHHPPGYGRHLHAHAAAAAAAAARYAPYPPQPQASAAAAAAAAARRSLTGSPVIAKDQRQLQMHALKASVAATAAASAAPTAEMVAASGIDVRNRRSSSQRSGHFAHRSPSVTSSSAAIVPPGPARTQHALAHAHHPLPPRPRVHHPSAAHAPEGNTSKSAPTPTTSTTPNQSPAIGRPLNPTSSASDSNGYRPSGSDGHSSSSDHSSSRSARTKRATRAAESRSTAAHEGSATSSDSSSSDPTRVPPSTTSSSGTSSTNTKTQSATSSAPETVPEPPPVPPVPPPQPSATAATQGKRARASKEPALEQASVTGVKQTAPPAALQLTKDRAWAQSVIEHVSDMVLSLAPNGTIVWASPSARKVVGFNAIELAGRHLGEFVHPEDAQLLTRTLTASIAHSMAPAAPSAAANGTAASTPRDSSFDVMVRFRRKNADYFLIHVTGRALHGSNAAAAASPDHLGRAPISPTSAAFTSSTQPFAPGPPIGIPVAPGIGLHPFSLPYNPGNLMAAAAALATASPLHTFPTATPAPARPPPLLVAVCREYPLGDHANQLDEVVGLRFENEMLREKLTAGYARRGGSPPPDSALRRSVGGEVAVKLTEIVLPASNGVATEGHVVNVPVGAGEGAGAASVGKKGLSAAIVPSDILRVAVERGVVSRIGAAAAGEGEGDESEGGTPGKGRGKGKKKRKLNGIKPSDERVCIDCGVTSSSEWRKGPMGAKTLCNACGLRYAKRKKDEAAARARAMAVADQTSTSGSMDPSVSDAASMSTSSASPPVSASKLAEGSSSSLSASSTPPAALQPPPASGSLADQAMDMDG